MKKQLKNMPLILAMPVVLVATKDGERLNFAPHGQCGQISAEPPVVYISVIKEHLTAKIIEKTQAFSVNIPTPSLIDKLMHCGNVSGMDDDKSGVFNVFYGSENIPLISDCPINLSCRVVKTVEINGLMVFMGEVVETFADENCMGEEMPDILKANPLLCSMDGRFWSVRDGFAGSMR